MNIRLQQFGFRESPYERPNQKWVCGWASEGKPCKIGPDGRGRCSAGLQSVCRPVRRGDRWHCTRPEAFGGVCEQGPRPDGSCCRPAPEHPTCQPRLSLRAKRGRFAWACFVFTLGGLSLLLAGSWGPAYLSPGPLASHHAILETPHSQGGYCAACHVPDPSTRNLLQPVTDTACLSCHAGPAHHPSRSREPIHPASFIRSVGSPPMAKDCTRCHSDHHGREQDLARVLDHACTSCHADLAPWRTASVSPLLTNRITSFGADHPEMRWIKTGRIDPTPIRFEHHVHLALGEQMRQRIAAWIDAPGSRAAEGLRKTDEGTFALTCAACHEADATGQHMRPIRFQTHCVQCHALGNKVIGGKETPIPHGSTVGPFIERMALEAVAAKLQSPATPPEPAPEPARRGPGARKPPASRDETPKVEAPFIERVAEEARKLNGRLSLTCGYCHDPAASPATMLDPKIPTRWLTAAEFNHNTHRFADCTRCHPQDGAKPVERPTTMTVPSWTGRTKELMLPPIATCKSCHAPPPPPTAIRHDCVLCHKYHAP